MKDLKDIPVYKGVITENDNDGLEVDYIALVKNPAIKSNFLTFKEESLSYSITNEDEQIITGLAMVADMPLYRKMEGKGEFFVVYDAPEIAKIAQKFFRKKYNFNLNLNHDPNYKTDDVYIFESWIVDREKGKFPMKQFEDVANGSWLISAKIESPELWQRVKSGEFLGFSVQGLFGLERMDATVIETELSDEQFDEELIKLIQAAGL
ncbi:MAG: XkdF-like putative serine protease domain-containing protein [Ferruginibacter sp.]